MELLELFNIQGTLFLMILVGALVKKLGIVDEAGRRCLTDLCVNVIIPCNILKSCLIDLDSSVLSACEILVVVALAIQIISVILNKFLYKNYPEAQNKVLKYCTLVSNGGFLGNGVAEGVYGTLGLLYASMYLIPMRIVMWSAGTSYFVAGGTDKKKVVRNILTHPCLVAVYIRHYHVYHWHHSGGCASAYHRQPNHIVDQRPASGAAARSGLGDLPGSGA